MKNVMLILLALSIQGCKFDLSDDGGLEYCELNDCSEKEPKAEEREIEWDTTRIFVNDADDSFIGYALDWHKKSAFIYDPFSKYYQTVELETGEHAKFPSRSGEEIYFSDSNCVGEAVVTAWNGPIGSTVIHAENDRYYVLDYTEYHSKNNQFFVRSKLVVSENPKNACKNVVNTKNDSNEIELVEAEPKIEIKPTPVNIDKDKKNSSKKKAKRDASKNTVVVYAAHLREISNPIDLRAYAPLKLVAKQKQRSN